MGRHISHDSERIRCPFAYFILFWILNLDKSCFVSHQFRSKSFLLRKNKCHAYRRRDDQKPPSFEHPVTVPCASMAFNLCERKSSHPLVHSTDPLLPGLDCPGLQRKELDLCTKNTLEVIGVSWQRGAPSEKHVLLGDASLSHLRAMQCLDTWGGPLAGFCGVISPLQGDEVEILDNLIATRHPRV